MESKTEGTTRLPWVKVCLEWRETRLGSRRGQLWTLLWTLCSQFGNRAVIFLERALITWCSVVERKGSLYWDAPCHWGSTIWGKLVSLSPRPTHPGSHPLYAALHSSAPVLCSQQVQMKCAPLGTFLQLLEHTDQSPCFPKRLPARP